MKKIRLLLTVSIVTSVFLICFLIGRAAVVKNSVEKEKNDPLYSDGAVIPRKTSNYAQADAQAENVEKETLPLEEEPEKISDNDKEKKDEENIALKMLFPCSETILKPYSPTAIYSKTTDDWRAHLGIDYEAPLGSDVISASEGVVLSVYKDKLWGYCVEIFHKGDVLGIYRNLQAEIFVNADDNVSGGQIIGKVGDSAPVEKLDKPHLHFETWYEGMSVNPESYVYR